MKKSKQAYYDRYFEKNWHNIKNIWKGNKSLISLKTIASSIQTVLSLDNGDTITNPYIAKSILLIPLIITLPLWLKLEKKRIKYSHKDFSDYLSKECDSAMSVMSVCGDSVMSFCNLLIKKK